jgi:RNA polymerase sigma factor (sigma-70 family)
VKPTRFGDMTDTELLEHFYSDRDQKWLGMLLERYTLLLFGVCMKYLKNEHEAKDAVQQVFLKVLTEAGKYRIEYFKSWLYMVAKNYCLMRLRDKGKATKELTEQYEAEKNISRQELISEEENYDLLEESLNELSDEQRQCVILFYLKKYSYSRIAEKTGFTMMQVKSFIQNGKRNLKIIMEKKIREKSERRS